MYRIGVGQHFNPDTDWMSAAERKHFQQLRMTGFITVFRTDRCAECGAEIVKGKRYCSKECKEKVMEEFKWEIELDGLIGQRVRVESTDGMYREGKISNFSYIEFDFFGKKVRIPEWIELEGDPGNRFDLNRCAKVSRVWA